MKLVDIKQTYKESGLSKEIKVLAEVEKIWIIWDVLPTRSISKDEIQEYLNQMSYPKLEINPEQVLEVIKLVDQNEDGFIDKEEMAYFLKVLMVL